MTIDPQLETPLTVLCVDDEQEILRSLERLLRRTPYRILTAQGAERALKVLGEDQVDVLIADVDMPEMNGLELVQIARRDHPEMVRMLLTGRTSFDTAIQAINQGSISKYLTKPWDEQSLLDTLDELGSRVHEIRGAARVARATEVHARKLARIEHKFPGISAIRRGADGAVELDTKALVAAVLATEWPALRALLP